MSLLATACTTHPLAAPRPGSSGSPNLVDPPATESPAPAPSKVAASPSPGFDPQAFAPAKLVPAGGALFGAYVQPAGGWSFPFIRSTVGRLEQEIGRKLDIDQHFYPWNASFPTEAERWDLLNGRIPMITWDGTSSSVINTGQVDSLIRQRARAVAALRSPVFLRWFAEMDSAFKAPRVGTPAAYVAAWRHVHDTFVNEGATNALWVWSPDAIAVERGKAQAFYPGDEYVDWVGADGYNWSDARPGTDWTSLKSVFEPVVLAYGGHKPIMIAETGCLEDGGDKAKWLENAVGYLQDTPAIRAFVYFDATKKYDWRVNSSPAALAAFRVMARHPYFNRRSSG
jgi:hypothetical protein